MARRKRRRSKRGGKRTIAVCKVSKRGKLSKCRRIRRGKR